ncbi:hypothetical protein F5X96DRAFT_543969 [Biscogniauxia mediterranea]|nr:hypothetical protein F5X96DRAFT_543969 [Biscogniauxia mediterranea]
MSRLRDNDSIIIVGSGVIGLSTAYNLAKASSDSPVKIRVIEVFTRPFTATSSTCTGCFHYGFPESQLKPLLPLGKYSYDLWSVEAENADFKAATGYKTQSSFGIRVGKGYGLNLLPDWVKKDTSWDVNTGVLGARTATVNPIGLGKWLTEQCTSLGVEIQTGLKVAGASLSDKNEVTAVTCLAKDGTAICIRCKQLLLACGPWTPTVYRTLFPSSPIHLQWTTDAGDWIRFRNPCPRNEGSTAFVSFADIVGNKLEFAGRNDGTIWACGQRNRGAVLPLPGQIDTPDENLIAELSRYAKKWIEWRYSCTETHKTNFQLLGKGRAFRPATKSGLPVISEVPSSDLTRTETGQSQSANCSSGVFICWGHGSYGLTLGMGSGRLMSQLMRGENPDIDISQFSLSKNCRRVEEQPRV